MRILIISFTFPPNKDGVSEAAAAMALGFMKRGWSVDVLTQEAFPPRQSTGWQGARIQEFSYLDKSYEPPIRLLGSEKSYEQFLVDGDWDVVVVHAYEYPLRRAVPVMNRMKGRKILVSHGYGVLLWTRTPRFPYGLRSWARSALSSRRMPGWLSHFDRVVYLSQQADLRGFYDHFIAKRVGFPGIRVIPNGVDPDERGGNPADFRRRHGIADDAFMLVCVANYSPRKDQAYGARAFRRAAIPNSVLVFIGSDFNEYSQAFQASDEATHPAPQAGRIVWLEKQTREATLDALAGSDCFLLSANHEAQPIAILEAMREGKPWIARDAGCISSMEGGLCVRSERAMAAAMVNLAKDPARRLRLGQEGSEAVRTRYNRDTYTRSYCALVEELTSAP